MLDQTSSDYQNTSFVLDISSLEKRDENKAPSVNDYCRTYATEDNKAEMSDTEAAEEKLMKPSDEE